MSWKAGRSANDRRFRSSREEKVRLNANLPKSFYKEVKRWALEHEMTVTEMVIEALRRYMAEEGRGMEVDGREGPFGERFDPLEED